ncbi:hypothetical protein BC792_10333 [Sphingobacterium allocomposti]|jgi:YHS domain-containing protein|uniref:MlpB protein n=1 Tax=Sphingobacterium allocomposti TaxID=415956 RepID=A0A5S5DMF7_9SPHI|nr:MULTISPECIES: hypothetical protein [Bacteroidota]OJZ12718.1 MAG: hypothetical protein BGP15_05490 [Sphingobacterium sp. 40-24]TYP97107.1 hypothetical protein BC792_10333 [Sphingobacterium composti Yoo et al. 2007 non Ten et al. 2007]
MKVQFKFLSIVAFATVLLIGCSQNKSNEGTSTNEVTTATPASNVKSNEPKKGDHVPSNLVCMVNDAYMGKQQLEVPFDGKTYYGCCEMCKKRIPQDESVRYALDPQTMKKVDKATAYIVLIADGGEVAYFENEQNYTAFKNGVK